MDLGCGPREPACGWVPRLVRAPSSTCSHAPSPLREQCSPPCRENVPEADRGSEPCPPDAVTGSLSSRPARLSFPYGSTQARGPDSGPLPARCGAGEVFAAGALCAWGVGSWLLGPALPPCLPAPRPPPSGPSVLLVAPGGGHSRSACGWEPAAAGLARRVPSCCPPRLWPGVLGWLGPASPWALLSSSRSLFLCSRPSEEEAGGARKGASSRREAHVHCQQLLFLFFIFLTD